MPDLSGIDGPHRARLRNEARELIERGIRELPLPFRMPLVLSDIAELSIAEIAAVLGLKEATVKTRLHRARLKLRALLAAGLPQRPAPEVEHSRAVCLDLLRAKLEAQDRHVPFPYADQSLCERCRTLFATLDLVSDVCATFSGGKIADSFRKRLLTAAKTTGS
jgi:hypothetical protein